MASKSRKRAKGRTNHDPVEQVKRSLDRGDYKQALKDARVWYRQSPGGELRCYLEHAYMGRLQQLIRNGLTDDARRIAGELLDLGVTETAVESILPDVLLAVGMLDRLPQAQGRLTDEDHRRLAVKAADQAVVRPGNTPASMKELRGEAKRIRAALEAVERGDEAGASDQLKEISRQSVFADWKYFIRGLMAYYRKDRSEMEANWGRLAPDRAAASIAAPLKIMAGMPVPEQGVALRAKIARLEAQAAGQSVLSSLIRLRQLLADHNWAQVVKTFRVVRQTLRDFDVDLYQKVIDCLWGSLAREGCLDELVRFSRIADPPALDPRWNRAQAIACENSEYYDDDPRVYWQQYLDDLETLPWLPVSQRNLARGLIWLHLAEDDLEEAVRFRGCPCGRDHSEEVELAMRNAEFCFRACMRAAPDYAPGYMLAARFYREEQRPREAAEVYAGLLERVPDHLDALTELADHHVRRGSARQALQYAIRARDLKPLDKATGELLWTSQLGMAEELGRAGDYDQAREALAAADSVLPMRAADCDVMARKAVLEIKANNPAGARSLVEQALERLEEPTVLWLAMTLAASRYQLKLEEVLLYEERWREALRRRCRSSTAGGMCRLIVETPPAPQADAELSKYARDLWGYVKRCSRVKWNLEDLRAVCEFLGAYDQWSLLMKFVKKGIRRFPEVGYFHHLVGVEEIRKGPLRFNRKRTIDAFQRAILLASASSDPRDRRLLEEARKGLSVVTGMLPGVHSRTSRNCDPVCHWDDDDDDEAPSDGVPFADMTVEAIRELFEQTCARLGLDPEQVIDELNKRGPARTGATAKTKGLV